MNSSSSSSNPLWEALVHHALVGNGQHPLSKELKKHLKELNIESDDDKHALLEGIGIVQLLEKGAQEWIISEKTLKKPPSFKKEKPCTQPSMQHLRAILDGHHAPAFSEFTHLLAKHGRSLPPTSLPKLLDQCVQNVEFWRLIQPILGERGFWLLQQHPIWRTLIPQKTETTDWYKHQEAERSKMFISFRTQSPKAARESLLKYWSDFDYKTKAQLLPAFNHGLSLADEDFLERCLDDKRKEVRSIAAQQLGLLSDSKLTKRLFNAANACLLIKDKALQIKLPEDLPNHTKRDGISPTGSKHPGGLNLNWLSQLIARIPFCFWEKEWHLDATEIVHIFAQSGYPSIVEGITESLLRFPHIKGTHAQIKMWIDSGNDVFWKSPRAKELLLKAEADFFNTSLIQWLEQHGPFLPGESLPTYWLTNSQHIWQEQLSKIVLLGFQDIIQNRSSPDWNLYHYNGIIAAAAYHTKSVLLVDFKKRWYMQTATFGRWGVGVEKFLQILSFRAEMQAALQ